MAKYVIKENVTHNGRTFTNIMTKHYTLGKVDDSIKSDAFNDYNEAFNGMLEKINYARQSVPSDYKLTWDVVELGD